MAYLDDPQTQKANLSYIRAAMNEPILEKDHELNLARRWREKQDEAALHELIRSYTRLVIAAASKFKHYGLPIGDLIQEGNIGLLEAANRFEPDRELRFSTYASWWIRSQMQDYILRNWSIVRTGTTSAQKSLFFNLRRLRSKIEGREERALDAAGREEIAKELGVKVKDVEAMEGRMSGGDHSLNAPISNDDGEDDWQGLLADDRATPEDVVTVMKDGQTRSAWLENALSTLSDREQKIIRDRHLTHETVTLETLGKDLGVSKERVRQLEQRAMEKLRSNIHGQVPNTDELFL